MRKLAAEQPSRYRLQLRVNLSLGARCALPLLWSGEHALAVVACAAVPLVRPRRGTVLAASSYSSCLLLGRLLGAVGES